MMDDDENLSNFELDQQVTSKTNKMNWKISKQKQATFINSNEKRFQENV